MILPLVEFDVSELDPVKIEALGNNLSKKRIFKDRLIETVIRLSGFLVLIAILGIFYVILDEVFPLFKSAKINSISEILVPLPENKDIKTISFGYTTDASHNFLWSEKGDLLIYSTSNSLDKKNYQLNSSLKVVSVIKSKSKDYFYITTENGELFGVDLNSADKDKLLNAELLAKLDSPLIGMKNSENEKQKIFVGLKDFNQDKIQLFGLFKSKGLLASKPKELFSSISINNEQVSSFELTTDGKRLLIGCKSGNLILYDISKLESPSLIGQKTIASSTINAMRFLIQGQTLILGLNNGQVLSLQEKNSDSTFPYQVVSNFKSHHSSVKDIYPSQRNRMFITLDDNNIINVHNSTTRQTQYVGSAPEIPFSFFAFSPKSNEFVTLDRNKDSRIWGISNNYSDVSFKTLFSKVLYENYSDPTYVWQSSSGSDEFEPKYNLMPLIFGTLKGTFYALLFAVPIAIFGAIYVSEFMKPEYKVFVKPVVELMAAVPSVVIGFMAGLWLAPNLESYILTILIFPIICFSFLFAVLFFYVKFFDLKNKIRKAGAEFFAVFVLVLISFFIAYFVARILEAHFFPGGISKFLLDYLGIIYDQRNSLVVSIAMGYAVIPLIFTLAEDSISAIPRHLREGSYALGASVWQTASRVVIPAASPGIFSAILLGFGRAIGETMIVLMATGNTPIIDLSPFNGFRALSANIAVELPEATAGGALYRIIFLSAFLLLIFSFLINTLTEIIRVKLRKKYG